MNEAKAILKAICDNPDDDVVRLVYADWLDEHGAGWGDPAERAEFIRVQIELARIEGDDPRRPTLARREEELLGAHRERWAHDVAGRVHGPRFERGFLTGIDCSTEALTTTSVRSVFAENPVTAVWLSGGETNLRAAARTPLLTRVRDLGVFRAHPDGLTALLASQFVTVLRGLHLQRLHTPTVLDRLADFFPILERPDLKHLTRLSLNFAGLDVHELGQFARLDVLSGLAELTLECDAMRDTAAGTLAASPSVAGLRILRLRHWRLTDAGVALLAESPHLSGLRRLSLFAAQNVTDAGLSALAVSPHLRNLTDLDLRYTEVTTDGVNASIESPSLPRLTRLILTGTPAAGAATKTDSAPWHTCPPDQYPGVVWVPEVRTA